MSKLENQLPMSALHPPYSREWFDEAFANSSPLPPQLRNMAERMCREFNIRGICDPMYIANVAAFELGMGDGRSSFDDRPTRPESPAIEKLAQRFLFAYATCISDKASMLRPLLVDELDAAKWE